MTQLYVGNLSEQGDEKNIRALFGKYGIVREVLMKNGYAFVEMDNALQAEIVMRELNGKQCSTMHAYMCLLEARWMGSLLWVAAALMLPTHMSMLNEP